MEKPRQIHTGVPTVNTALLVFLLNQLQNSGVLKEHYLVAIYAVFLTIFLALLSSIFDLLQPSAARIQLYRLSIPLTVLELYLLMASVPLQVGDSIYVNRIFGVNWLLVLASFALTPIILLYATEEIVRALE